MNMKKTIYTILPLTAMMLLHSCARPAETGLNDAAVLYFESWISQNYPTATKTPLGSYIISEETGSGTPMSIFPYFRINYSSYTLDGELSGTTVESVARQNNIYSKTTFYGPMFGYRGENYDAMSSGLEEILSMMNGGGRCKVAIPGWLSTSDRYDTPEEYIKNCSGTDLIYDLELVEPIFDIESWEKDSLTRFVRNNWPGARQDSLDGFWYQRLDSGSDKSITKDSTVYINYIGRRLDGAVFDTNIADTAKVWGLYSDSKEYAPAKIKWYSSDQDYKSITMGSDESSIIEGFAFALSRMHRMEKGICFFWSGLGYSASGSGSSIPAYCPLSFEIEMTTEP